MLKRQPVNIKDIAKKAGVSSATVSRVINQPHLVKRDTRIKVQKVIDSEHYSASSIAKQLRMNQSFTIGFIPTSVNMNFYSNIGLGIEDTARKNDYSVIFCNSHDIPEKEKQYLNVLLEKRVDGIILSPTGQNRDIIGRIKANGIPVCFIDRIIEGVKCDYVVVDNEEATRRTVKDLFSRGYSRIGFIAPPPHIMTGQERIKGYKKAYEESGYNYDANLISISDLSVAGGKKTTHDLIEKQNLDVVFVANELTAAGALEAVLERGLRIPEDIGFVMWDDPEWTRIARPQISVIAQPLRTIGETAAELLFKRLSSERTEEDSEPIRVMLKTSFIERGSLR